MDTNAAKGKNTSVPLQHHYVTVVLALPSDPDARKPVLDALPLGGYFKNARITAMQIGDAISELEAIDELGVSASTP